MISREIGRGKLGSTLVLGTGLGANPGAQSLFPRGKRGGWSRTKASLPLRVLAGLGLGAKADDGSEGAEVWGRSKAR